jgi:hypothetical protein
VTGDDLSKLLVWKAQIKKDVQTQNSDTDTSQSYLTNFNDSGDVELLENPVLSEEPAVSVLAPEASLSPVDPFFLKANQYRAYDIIMWHLERTLAGKNVSPLWMIVYGKGGTGKLKVIQTVTQTFAQKGIHFMLIKSATQELWHPLSMGRQLTHWLPYPWSQIEL